MSLALAQNAAPAKTLLRHVLNATGEQATVLVQGHLEVNPARFLPRRRNSISCGFAMLEQGKVRLRPAVRAQVPRKQRCIDDMQQCL